MKNVIVATCIEEFTTFFMSQPETWTQKLASVVYLMYFWYQAGPCGAPGHKSLSVSPISLLQEIGFTPQFQWGRFKQLLIREGRGCRDKGGTVKRLNSAALGQCPGSPSRDTHNNILELFCRYWNPHQVGEVNCLLSTSTETPDGLEPEGWWCWLPPTSPPTNQKNVHQLIKPSLNHYYKTSHYPLEVRTHSFEGISPLWPPLPGQAVKLFFSTSPKTLSPRINSVLGYRGQIWLHFLLFHIYI